MFGIGIQELLIIFLILLLLFGGKKLPELSRSLGEAIREMRKAVSGDDNSKEPASQDKKDGK